jgi:restriction endonuclease S subunit
VESLTGPIPDGWPVTPLGEVCEVDAGSAQVDRAARSEPGTSLRVVTPGHIAGHRLDTGDGGLPAGTVPGQLTRYRLALGDLVFARAGHLGRVALVGAEHENWLLGGGCLRLRARPGLHPRYLLHYLGHPRVAGWLSRSAMGSVIPTHSLRNLRALPVVLPPPAEQERIAGTLTLLDDKIETHQRIVRSTTELRDRLLQLMLAGHSPDSIAKAAGSAGRAAPGTETSPHAR